MSQPKAKKPIGRPTDYTPEKAEHICVRIAEGATWRVITAEDGMPDMSTITRWLMRHEDFNTQYTRAMETRALVQSLKLEELVTDEGGEAVDDQVRVARHRLITQTCQWNAERMARKHFGPTSKVEMTGKDGKDLIPPRSLDEIEARIVQLDEANPGMLDSILKRRGGK